MYGKSLRTLLLSLLCSLFSAFPVAAANKVNMCGGTMGDIPLFNQISRMIVFWCDGSPSSSVMFGPVATNWQIIGIANFNGVAQSDILRENFTTGQISIWPEGNASLGTVTGTLNTSAGYTWLNSFGDFNGDGKDDLVVWSATTSTVALWPSGNAGQSATLGTLSPGWQPHMVADVNNDGVADLVLRETQNGVAAGSGRYSYWLGGNPTLSGFIGAPGQPWEIMAFGRFTANQTGCNILWYNAVTGDLATSTGCGAQLGAFSSVGILGWPVYPFMAEDVNGDGITDIVNVHTNTSTLSRWSGSTAATTYFSQYNSADSWGPIFPYRVWYH